MIGLVFARRTYPEDSWWVDVSREAWAEKIAEQVRTRWGLSSSTLEPTARRMKSRDHVDRDAVTGEEIDRD